MSNAAISTEERILSLKWTAADAILYANSIGIGGSSSSLISGRGNGDSARSGGEQKHEGAVVDAVEWRRLHELPFVYVAGRKHPSCAYPTTPLGLMFRAAIRPPAIGSQSSNSTREGEAEAPFVIWEDQQLKALVDFDALKLLHGTQCIRWHLAPPGNDDAIAGTAFMPPNLPEGVLTHQLVALDVKKNAVVSFTESSLYVDATRKIRLCTLLSSMFLRGGKLRQEGITSDVALLQKQLSSRETLVRVARRWGVLMKFGEPTSTTKKAKPEVTPTKNPENSDNSNSLRKSLHYQLAVNQGSLYRLNGDSNPIHIDPVAAQSVGLPQPIVHGLCTFGYASRALLQHLPQLHSNGEKNEESLRLAGMNGKFVAPVLDGDSIEVVVESCSPSTEADELRSKSKSKSSVVVTYHVFAYSGNTSSTVQNSTTTTKRLVLRGVAEYSCSVPVSSPSKL